MMADMPMVSAMLMVVMMIFSEGSEASGLTTKPGRAHCFLPRRASPLIVKATDGSAEAGVSTAQFIQRPGWLRQPRNLSIWGRRAL